MKRSLKFLSFVCAFLFLAGTAAAAGNQTTSYLGFNPATGLNDKLYNIIYRVPEPAQWGNGPYPVYMWTPGAFERYTGNLAMLFIAEMSTRGFVAATIQYDNAQFAKDCEDWTLRASSIYDATRSTSAVSVVCALEAAACSTGLVTMGMSQGAGIAILAKNYAPNVQAVLGFSVSDIQRLGLTAVNFGACIDKPATAIPVNRLMIVNGRQDSIFGGQAPLMRVSGLSCPEGTSQCWSPGLNGAGWYIVQDGQVVDALADHCYMLNGGCSSRTFDDNWYLGTYNWSFKPNLDWLATFGISRNFSPTGQ